MKKHPRTGTLLGAVLALIATTFLISPYGRMTANVSRPQETVQVGVHLLPAATRNGKHAKRANEVQLAIMSTPDFDAAEIDLASIVFAGAMVSTDAAGNFKTRLTDVDGDGLADLVVTLARSALQVGPEPTKVTFNAQTRSGRSLVGGDCARASGEPCGGGIISRQGEADSRVALNTKVINGGTTIVSAGATLVSESCTPANGAIDPNETVTVSLCIRNSGGASTTSALTGTLQATGGVTSPSGPQNYGAIAPSSIVCRNFTFTANGSCGGTLTASLQLQDGATNYGTLTYTFTLGVQNVVLTENFDGVSAPALPAGWTASQGTNLTGAPPWQTSTTSPDTAPNDAFSPSPNNVLDNRLDSPSISITTAAAQLTFRNFFDLNDSGGGFDGGVLEVSTDGGATWADITSAGIGGSFVQNGYNRTISVNFASPIAGRQAWSGTSGGYVTTIANLGANLAGKTIKLRWREASDNSVVANGWRVDTISITDGFTCCTAPACTITCPANITQSNDPNQCGAVVNYPAPTASGCGTVTCSPASGSFFPKGTTTVTCTTAGPSCSFTITVNDTQPPTITCPANQTAVTAQTCPFTNAATVTFPSPTASDNCPSVTVACTPPSGSTFALGTTTVTCTATDTSGNTATCSFTVTVFSGCLQDDANPGNVVLFNLATGDYRYCCNGTAFTGRGKVSIRGCIVQIDQSATDRRVQIKADFAAKTGTASLQIPVGTIRCTISDRNTTNNTCACGSGGGA
ncbi:MAG TPA: HYR domain-containing protein [Blastocatellia bacterium]|nr:HYR domain-containing protein [Blastocatellia bacterium]